VIIDRLPAFGAWSLKRRS